MWLTQSRGTPVALDLVCALVYKYRETKCLLRIYHLEAAGRMLNPFSTNQASFRHGFISHQDRKLLHIIDYQRPEGRRREARPNREPNRRVHWGTNPCGVLMYLAMEH